MTLTNALDIVVGRTRHERYRWLCSDANPDAAQRDGYRQLVMQQAINEPPEPVDESPPLIPLPEVLAGLVLVRLCQWRSRDAGCGCSGARCAIRGTPVSDRNCLDCVRIHGDS